MNVKLDRRDGEVTPSAQVSGFNGNGKHGS